MAIGQTVVPYATFQEAFQRNPDQMNSAVQAAAVDWAKNLHRAEESFASVRPLIRRPAVCESAAPQRRRKALATPSQLCYTHECPLTAFREPDPGEGVL